MKGNEKVIDALGALLVDELAAANQYILHAEICENWKYGNLHNVMSFNCAPSTKWNTPKNSSPA